ncbi:MAG: hypothetical protein GY854_30755 [Deltaproteobacteria bacterium]|nr:hypothetical protein [Deltaproteobacteria bacterium]
MSIIRSLAIVSILIGLFIPFESSATIEIYVVNHITRECGSHESGNLYTPIGWESCSRECRKNLSQYCSQIGYEYVGKPTYTIEKTILLIILVAVSALYLKKNPNLRRRLLGFAADFFSSSQDNSEASIYSYSSILLIALTAIGIAVVAVLWKLYV